jgi:hypothetical protein
MTLADVVRDDTRKLLGFNKQQATDLESKEAKAVGPVRFAEQVYSLIVDTSVDISNTEQLLVYTKTTVAGVACTRFLGVVCVPNGKGETIADASLTLCKKLGMDTARIVCFCSDGASAMTGVHSGAGTLIREEVNSTMISVHCAAHRTALAGKDASDAVTYLKNQFKSTLQQLFVFFDGSATRNSHLKQVKEYLDESVTLVRNGDTRWLSYERTVISLYGAFSSVLITLIEESCMPGLGQAMATGLATTMGSACFIRMLLLWCDIIPLLADLSRKTQAAEVDFVQVEAAVDICVAAIKAAENRPGEYEQEYDAFVAKVTADVHDRGGKLQEEEAGGAKIKGSLKMTLLNFSVEDENKRRRSKNQPFSVQRGLYLADLIVSLRTRFPDSELLSAMARLFDPRHFPVDNVGVKPFEAAMEAHGSEALDTICAHFSKPRTSDAGPLFDFKKLPGQYDTFKTVYPKVIKLARVQTKDEAVRMRQIIKAFLSSEWAEALPAVSAVAKVAASIAMTSAEVERGFSVLKHTKTADRCT